jgi:hypothetical protein
MKTRDLHRIQPRRDQIKSHHIQEEVHDPYKARKKPHGPLHCPRCGAVNLGARWEWAKEKPAQADEEFCPACHRIQDDYPAGEVILSGGFLAKHKAEIVELVRNTEKAEQAEHPLQRIIRVNEAGDQLVITTTDIHLPRRIGHAVVDAYKGELETHYDLEGYFARIKWARED